MVVYRVWLPCTDETGHIPYGGSVEYALEFRRNSASQQWEVAEIMPEEQRVPAQREVNATNATLGWRKYRLSEWGGERP